MMKNIIKITGIAAILLSGVGCSEEFLDKQPSEFLTQDQVAEAASNNPEVIAGSVAGIYTLMFEDGSGGTTGHDDFGHKAYDIYGDMLSGDVALSVSSFGWYRSNITEFQATQDFTNLDNYQIWRYYYRIIRSANLVIDALGGNDAVPELDANKYLMGQAKAMRAHSYFYLTQYYTKSYNPSAEILPIYVNSDDQNGPKVAASEIFNLIESDLNDAITLLDGFNRSAKTEVNKSVAQGILAYVYAFKGDNWQAVKDLTGEVIDQGGFRIMSRDEVVGGFNDVNTPGWMWGTDLTTDSNVGLLSWWGQMDYFSYSYAGYGDYKAIDSDLYAQISDDDVRKTQFYDDESSSNYLQPWFKFYEEARVPRGSGTTILSDLLYMRVAEMYLLHAEAAANLGMDGEAIAALQTLLNERVDDSSYLTSLSGSSLKDEIYLQTRIELWGEGKSYLALKRNKETVVRGDNHLSFVGVPISYDDERLTFEIPEAEILYNPAVSTQND
ncbi:putative outer membrane starch-binding protein [Christiangramia gaetbulicola]|uniref:Putative outer membrane starch-binding protein n=1 Tax=Christiangramia gaetbulicola TaxID=703340 RepID=A0A2T6AD42_9FLAO|nr:RagB/SusD family nutrient uptake outer membrane protein [Christiangramia gaetbulicola]PTX41733.1 putative outer membrane starch-binding protein [Christiangramia gaetbulicola]